ncbi:MAG: DNA topoisomerase I [Gammaproteobacteria bacterium]|jgi:DNA topoisomerase-1
MSKHLIVVESPAKSKTLEKYLGKDFKVLASYGHVRDLRPKEGAVDPEHGFAMSYEIIERNQKHVDAIARALKKADALYLATDPDREGEAISWHLFEILKERGLLEDKPVHRVVFHEITRSAIDDAMGHPRQLSAELVDAQQARRALDYLVGFNLSPLLWRKIKQGLSAGRVQSPALRMICEREREIEQFKPREYWTIEASAESGGQAFPARLARFDGEKIEQFSITDGERAKAVETQLREAAGGQLAVTKVSRKQRRRNPAPPFTTSTLQQEASRKLGFGAQKTMRTAQRLYEGIDVGEGSVGLITYMRTDSVALANEAVNELRQVIVDRFGKENLPDRARLYKTKSKNAQEAHEAIRPTSAARHPDTVKAYLDRDQARLYDLIWKRAVACQMESALFDTVAVDLKPAGDERGNANFRATGSVLVKPGYRAVYMEGRDDAGDDDTDRLLPALEEGDAVKLLDIITDQHFTEPPPRFSEASLVKALEEYGIGRPSTYASIISTLQNREYVEMDRRRFIPTDIGRIVNRFLTDHFTRYVDYDFTARLEDELDAISRGEEEWVPLLERFWKPFIELVEDKATSVTRAEAAQARELGTDPKSGRPVTVRMGRYGPFVQIGTRDDEEKPKFAGLRPGQKMDTIELPEALELFKLPRALGETAEGEDVSTNIGRFGPYVRYGKKYVSLKADDDPFTITLERALELIREKKEADANRTIKEFEAEGILVLNGRYGPYITDGNKNARIPKDVDPASLTLEQCQEAIEKAPARRGRKKAAAKKKTRTKKTAAKKTAAKKTPARKKAVRKKTAKKKASKKKAAPKKSAPRKTAALKDSGGPAAAADAGD